MPSHYEELIPIDEMTKGGLRKALKLKEDEKFKIGELVKANKKPIGEMFEFRGNQYKMTKKMKARITLAISLLRLPKRKNRGEFFRKNEGKKNKENPIDGDLLMIAASNHAMDVGDLGHPNQTTYPLNTANEMARQTGGIVFQDFFRPHLYHTVWYEDGQRGIRQGDRALILEQAHRLDRHFRTHTAEINQPGRYKREATG